MKKDKYDVVVIGSGVGGMCAGALMAHAGYKTLIVEKLPALGGRCSTLKYKGFTLSTGAEIIPITGAIGDTFREVGVEMPVRPIPRGPDVAFRVDHEDIEPKEPGFRGFLSLVCKDSKEVERVWDAIHRAVTWQAPLPGVSFKDWLSQYTQNQLIWEVFDRFAREHYSLQISELPAAEFIEYEKKALVFAQRGIAPEGNTTMWEALAGMMRKRGSHVWTRCRAKRILVENHTVKGVIVEKDGEEVEITTKAVISNAGPKITVDLAGRESFEWAYLKAMDEVPGVDPYMLAYVASDKPLYTGRVRLMFLRSRVLISARYLSALCPELAPPGKYLYFCGATFPNLPPLDWRKQADLCFEDLKDIFPGCERHAHILKLSCYYGDWPLCRSRGGYDPPQKTCVENLYNVGDGVKPPGTAASRACAESAWIVVKDLVQRFRPGEA